MAYDDSQEFTYKISLVDIDRVLGFCRTILNEFGDVHVYLRVDDAIFGIEDFSPDRIKALIKRHGGYGELDRIECLSKDFSIVADFSSGELNINSDNKRILEKLSNYLTDTITNIEPVYDRAVLKDCLLSEAKRFIFRSLQSDGKLSKTPRGEVYLNQDYIVYKLIDFGMEFVIRRYAEFLKKVQNEDGGWGVEPGLSSELLPTASAVLILLATNYTRQAEDGIKYIASNYKESGFWEDSKEYRLLPTAVCATAMYRFYGKRHRLVKESVKYLKENLGKASEGLINDYIAVYMLKDMGFKVKSLSKRLFEKLPQQDPNGGFPEGNPDVLMTASVANILLDVGTKENEECLVRATNFLLRKRNRGGYWESFDYNPMFTTIFVLLTLKRMRSFRSFFRK